MFDSTPVTPISFGGRNIFVKRDDLLHPEFSGNKARKFAYFLDNDFPNITKLIGYGSPQANSLYSMSALAKLKGWQLDFYVDHIAEQVKEQVDGNYARAIANGAQIISLNELKANSGKFDEMDCHEFIERQVIPYEPNAVFVPEGGRCAYAEYGVSILAKEIIDWANCLDLEHLKVCLPSGTGTTALFLNKYFVEQGTDISVITCAVVGGGGYLKEQFELLCPDEGIHPEILLQGKKYHFGKLYREFYQMWQRVNREGIEFELLYDPLGFISLEEYMQRDPQSPILYLHQGGLLGNCSMLPRYKRRFG